MGMSYLYGLTTTQCGTEGGEAGLEYGLEDEALEPKEEMLELGIGIATTPVIAPPRMYFQLPRGGGGGVGPPGGPLLPPSAGQLLYWREVD